MKKLLLLLALLIGGSASAQTSCPPPQLKAFFNNQQIKTTGSALPPNVTLILTSDPACATAVSYQVKEAEMTLIRGRRPLLPAKLIQGSEVDLTAFAKFARPGDRIFIEVHGVVDTPASGQPKPRKLAAGQRPALNWVVAN